ncbi:hypothetical protein CY0110_17747 [Crocosphaera chwakensis CCY0110]|uniref:Uncharacterized protein n=1 Tax=Crocosphaera chwakensis CCY0110 TaxID=391612 RepID=A3IIN1_9CHRO|nr:hypothetical protein CY0110_17747 [Crocosphaera chwakensis CCY0110]
MVSRTTQGTTIRTTKRTRSP